MSLIVNTGRQPVPRHHLLPALGNEQSGKTVCFQNDHIPLMNSYRDAGPAYPTEVIDEFATITFVRDCGPNDDSVIACAASELPENFPENLK